MLPSVIRANPRGWLVVGVLFFALALSFGARMSLPVLIPGWETEFGWSRSFLSGGAALIMIIMGSVAPFAGNLLDRFGPRYLVAGGMVLSGLSITASVLMQAQWFFIVVYCAAAAVGYGIVSMPVATATIARHFEQNRGLATSIGTAGVGGGQLLFIPLLAWAVTAVGWRPTLAAFGILIALLGIGSLLFLDNARPPGRTGSEGAASVATLGTKILLLVRSPVFWLIGGAYVICGFTTAGVIKVHLIPYATLCGFDLTTGAAANGVLAGFNMVGMVLSGYLTDRLHRPALLGSVYFLRALTFVLLFFITDNVALLFAFAVLFGTLDFATVPPTASLVASHLGVQSMGLSMGMLFAGHSLGGALGALTAGSLYDLYARYDWVWIIALMLAVVAAILAWSIPEKRETAAAAPSAAIA
jgi:MFS family permease